MSNGNHGLGTLNSGPGELDLMYSYCRSMPIPFTLIYSFDDSTLGEEMEIKGVVRSIAIDNTRNYHIVELEGVLGPWGPCSPVPQVVTMWYSSRGRRGGVLAIRPMEIEDGQTKIIVGFRR